MKIFTSAYLTKWINALNRGDISISDLADTLNDKVKNQALKAGEIMGDGEDHY